MTDTPNSTVARETMLAELAALPDGYEWIVEDYADTERTIADTHLAHAADIAARRREIAGDLEPDLVTFHLLEGEPWARTDLRSDARRATP